LVYELNEDGPELVLVQRSRSSEAADNSSIDEKLKLSVKTTAKSWLWW
jgi:hypothetical protein